MAAFLLINDARAHSFKQACYRACWRNGLDLSDRRVLYTVAEGVGLARTAFELLDHPHIAEIAALWHQQWDHTGVRRVPALIRRDGAKLVGLTDQHQIRRFLDGNDPDSL
jgi:predicted DsbA family dithiol-disulfide isomerase